MQGGRVMDSVGRPQDLRGLGLNKLGESAMSTRRSPRARMVTPSSPLQRPPNTPPPDGKWKGRGHKGGGREGRADQGHDNGGSERVIWRACHSPWPTPICSPFSERVNEDVGMHRQERAAAFYYILFVSLNIPVHLRKGNQKYGTVCVVPTLVTPL